MQFYRGGASSGQGVTGFGADTGGGGSYSVGSSGGSTTSETGKYNIDVTNPASSTIPGLDILGGIAGAIGNAGIPFVPGSTIKNVVGTAGDIVGGAGDIGVGGFGVKQTVGVAGDVLAAPQKYVQTRIAAGRILQAQRVVASGGSPSLKAAIGLPDDLQLQLDSGVSVEHVANELADRNAGYTNDPLGNTVASIVLDPMNLISAGVGKAVSLGARSGMALNAAREAQELGTTARDVTTLQRVLGTGYNAISNGLSRAGAAQAVRMIGPVTSGITRAYPEALPLIEKVTTANSAAGTRLMDALALANTQVAGSLWEKQLALRFKNNLGLVMDAAQRAGMAKTWIGNKIMFGKKEFEDAAYEFSMAHKLTPLEGADIPGEVARMVARTAGISEDEARLILPKATLGDWQAMKQLQFGAVAEDFTKVKALGTLEIKANGKTFAASEITPVSATTMPEHVGTQLADAITEAGTAAAKARREAARVAGQSTKKAAAGTVDSLKRPVPIVKTQVEGQLLIDVLGPASYVPPVAAVQTGIKTPQQLIYQMMHDYPEVATDLRAEAVAKGVKGLTPDEVVRYLRAHIPEMPTVVQEAAKGAASNKLPAVVRALADKWKAEGYQIGFEPKLGTKFADMGDGLYTPVRPFVPLLSDGLGVTQRNAIGRVYDAFMGNISQTRVISEAQARMVTTLGKMGVGQDQAHEVMSRILHTAFDEGSTPRAIWEKYDKIFLETLGPEKYAAIKARSSVAYVVNEAFEGNLRTVGLTQKITGKAKTLMASQGNIGVKLAENLYPALKFKYNPLFTTQEFVETPFWNISHGINPWGKAPTDAFETFYGMSKKNPASGVFEVGPGGDAQLLGKIKDAGDEVQAVAAEAAHTAFGPQGLWGKAIERVLPGVHAGGLAGFKQTGARLMAFKTVGADFRRAVESISPLSWQAIEDTYKATHNGVSDLGGIAQDFMEHRLNLVSGQRRLEFEFDAMKAEVGAGHLATPAEETGQQAFEWAVKQSSDRAYKTHFFNPNRGWLERTLNHPFLGLYPLSYMWGKVVPEFAGFLFKHPFGLDAPMLGYDAAQHVRDAMIVQMQDPEFAKQMEDNKGAIYLVQLLLPATPENIPVNSPAWARHLADAVANHKNFNPATEASSSIQHIGVMNLPSTLSSGLGGPVNAIQSGLTGALGGITDQLDNAAALYDGNVNQP